MVLFDRLRKQGKIDPLPHARQSMYFYIVFEIMGSLDSGVPSVPFEVVRDAAEGGRFLEFLEETLAGHADLSLVSAGYNPTEHATINHEVQDIAGGLWGRERRKFGTERNGLCLAIAYVLQAAATVYSDSVQVIRDTRGYIGP